MNLEQYKKRIAENERLLFHTKFIDASGKELGKIVAFNGDDETGTYQFEVRMFNHPNNKHLVSKQ